MAATILIVDDEPMVIDVMRPFFEREGFTVYTAASGPEALERAEEVHPDLLILDWMLPGKSGLDVCKEIRGSSRKVGIIMLTARADETDRVLGLEMGADDYIPKPFSFRELLARVRAVLRRIDDNSGEEETGVLYRGDLVIDPQKFQVWKRGEEVSLTPAEFQILQTLAERPGVVYSRLQLLRATLGNAYLNYERTVDSHISHLRKKIEDDPANPQYIQTVHGVGYRFGEFR
ncbi:response regulator transcription factor [Alicyclobacillus macrosporangiidus]|uniref:DNA-binding response regulator, OmpR family, contains REC and winged-helix (WHTH) domain n=1 Tax=Alicyclobacillus macrosporangiidus TaxID=392015 RepID=A0A1I7F5V6_9BACL|nr:response regulator transcription factor [Alicyclobacillus macrosporangiidus]SFU31581.1 DNA-binding response regulator, OmpR family, contains REC and winged-helix (wHTH) domain [Alicyclobacillus macrosporangiidus]